MHYKPVSSLRESGDGSIEFASAQEYYINLPQTMLYIEAKISPTPAEAAENAKVSVVNNTLHSLFAQVDIF